MAWSVVVVNESKRPLAGVTVEAIRVSDQTISGTAVTNDSGEATFAALPVGTHFFRPLIRRTSGEVGGRHFTGQVEVQIVNPNVSGICIDFIVDSAGSGTHTSLFGASGALAAALTAGGRQAIWICTAHTEPALATAHALGTQVNTKFITIYGEPGNRVALPVDAGSTSSMFTYHSDTDLSFTFVNIRFTLSAGVSYDIFSQIAGGGGIPTMAMEFDHCDFGNVRAIDNTAINAGFANGDKTLRDCTGALVNVLRSTAASGRGGDINIEHCFLSWTGRIAQLGDYSGSWGFDVSVRGGHHTVTDTEFYLFGPNIEGQFSDTFITFSATGGTLFTTGPGISERKIGDYTIFQNVHVISNRIDNKILDFPAGGAAWLSGHPNEKAIVIDGLYIRAQTSAGAPVDAVAIVDSANAPDVYLGLIGCAGDWANCYVGPASAGSGSSDHGLLSGLSDDDHSIYAFLAGRAGGQVLIGGTAASEDLTLQSTANATRGSVFLGSSSQFELDEVTGQLLLPTTGVGAGILIGGDAQWYRAAANLMATDDDLRVDGILTRARKPIVAKSGAYTITADDEVIIADASGASFTVTLPTAVGIPGKVYWVKKIDATANTVTVDADGSENIDGGLTAVIGTQYEAITVISDGTEWWVL